ncbi:hypothetical protein QNN00_18655 [Bacillus velezensis]|nr:hypothetical protein [Bacillus velezensis]
MDWCIVTANAQPFSDQDSADPSQAAVSGLAGTMAKEYPHWHIRMIDTETDGAGRSKRRSVFLPGKTVKFGRTAISGLFERR